MQRAHHQQDPSATVQPGSTPITAATPTTLATVLPFNCLHDHSSGVLATRSNATQRSGGPFMRATTALFPASLQSLYAYDDIRSAVSAYDWLKPCTHAYAAIQDKSKLHRYTQQHQQQQQQADMNSGNNTTSVSSSSVLNDLSEQSMGGMRTAAPVSRTSTHMHNDINVQLNVINGNVSRVCFALIC